MSRPDVLTVVRALADSPALGERAAEHFRRLAENTEAVEFLARLDSTGLNVPVLLLVVRAYLESPQALIGPIWTAEVSTQEFAAENLVTLDDLPKLREASRRLEQVTGRTSDEAGAFDALERELSATYRRWLASPAAIAEFRNRTQLEPLGAAALPMELAVSQSRPAPGSPRRNGRRAEILDVVVTLLFAGHVHARRGKKFRRLAARLMHAGVQISFGGESSDEVNVTLGRLRRHWEEAASAPLRDHVRAVAASLGLPVQVPV